MDAEETVNNATLWESYADEELAAIHDALVASRRCGSLFVNDQSCVAAHNGYFT